METPAYRKEGSNKHIKGCQRAFERFKLEIRELNTMQRARAAELALLPELASSLRALDEEEREIESALPGSIIKEEPIEGGRLPSARATRIRPQQSNFSSPSNVANADTPSNNNVQGSQSFPKHAATSTPRRSVQLSIKPMIDAAQREKADKLWSMVQAVMGLPFRTFKHPAFEEAYRFSSQFLGYKLPSEKRLRTTLLDANYDTVREETEKKMFDHMVWNKITISCDGWTNRNGRPQMNMLHISRHGELAHRHVDGSNETKSAVWIAEHITKDIEERGPPNVLQFVADNASANILAGKLVRERYPHIIFGGCVAHGLDLLMEDIGKLPWVKEVVNDSKKFIKFIKNHHMTNAMFLDFFSNGVTLLKPATTRTDAREAKETILDERFWDKVHDIVMMMEKIFVLLRQVDSHKDFLGRVFWESWKCQDILKNLHKSTELRSNIITPSSCDELFLLFRHRWNGWTNIIHTTAMLLNPAYLFDEERQEFSYHSFIMRDFQEYVTLFAKGVLQYSGEELVQYLHDVDKELDGITCLDGSIWTHIHREKALSERCHTSPMHWWAQAGRCAPKLRVIAMNILGLTCAASACERAWSSYAYVHSLSRVRLSIPRQHKLVYIYHNARINSIDQKRERKSAAVLNTFMKSNTQQSILKQRHGTEYGSTSNPRDAWIPDDVLQENGPEIALSNGDRVRVKTWDWTEPCYQEWKSGTRIPWMLISTLRPKFFPWRQYEITPS
ncbi:hypothetical protein R1sor_019037 [Riccia sorocarpa]|uniref:HAT C-terminal dimerisation domain-containing protein n=1 Tax=Riccia sorocarpa TaxID=122646 RepID=A0ABD3IF64_9MARC